MAVATTQITNFRRFPRGNSRFDIEFLYTGPASYTAGGEVLTKTVAQQAFEGVGNIDYLIPAPAAGSSFATMCDVAFEPINDGTNAGKIHFYNGTDAHTHGLLLTGGQAAGVAVQVTPDSAAGIIGKTTATNFTLAGGTSNIQNSTANAVASENAGAQNYSTFQVWFRGSGSM